MGGREAIRGFSVQFLFALIRATDPEERWEYMTIEHPGSESVDVLFEYSGRKLAVQVKSTERVFRKSEVQYWAESLERSSTADEYELALFGPVTEAVATARQIGRVRIPIPQGLDLAALTERACRRLERFLGDDLAPGIETELVAHAILQKLQSLAISGVRLSRSHFETLIRVWMSGPDSDADRFFSSPIREHFEALRKTVEELTAEQYHVITALRGLTRVRVEGTAGSGKTLIAAERAIRLDCAGLKTLVLCHSPNLAIHLSSLTSQTEVDVFDFDSWMNLLLGTEVADHAEQDSWPWTGYAEPYDKTLSAALTTLQRSGIRWDAIIVDEGQDIRSDWWPLIESALRHCQHSQLTIFCDGRQKVTGTSDDDSYPQTDSVFQISRNCRNASAVHNVVRRFYVYAPVSDDKLRGGEFQLTLLPNQTTKTVTGAVKDAVLQGLEFVEWNQLVILTAEGEPATASVLNDLLIWDSTAAGWKTAVLHYLSVVEYFIRSERRMNSKVFEPPKSGRYYPVLSTLKSLERSLSCDAQPTSDDVMAVQLATQQLTRKLKIKAELRRMQWIPGQGYLRLREYADGAVRVPSADSVVQFLMSHEWAETLPRMQDLKVIGTDKYLPVMDQSNIRLFTPSSFKGLEADGIVMYLGSVNHRIVQKSCVGLSRARFFLHVLGSREQLARLPKLK